MTKLSEWAKFDVNKLMFLDVGFLTDDQKLYAYLYQARSESGYKLDTETFDKEFPGVMDAAISAIRNVTSNNLRVEWLVYINGVMQAWCEPGFGDPATGLPHPPGKLCLNNKLYPVESK